MVVSTWEYPTNYGWVALWPGDLDLAADARHLLEQSVDKVLGADDHADITMTVVEGHPALTLVAYSRSASLVVVGSRGHGEFAGMLLGSVSEFLTTHAYCPVCIVRGDESTGSAR